jgi:light-regulated signal transduction histidine kinase (bacteriophytochrome)
MKNSLLLIKGKDESFASMVTEAMASAFPGARTEQISTLEEASGFSPSGGAAILVLVDPLPDEIPQAEGILDERRLPRWAVIPCIGPLASGNWSAQIAPHLLASAWTAHKLRRENATLRGNLRSIGVRVAHDMRTPLGGILSAAESLKEGIAENDPSNIVWVDSIIESEVDLLRLVRHQAMIADELARPVQISKFDMGEAVSSAMEWLEGRLTQSGSTLAKPPAWPVVHADRGKCERIWNLLVENSVRHGGQGRVIQLGWEDCGEFFKFWVSNDGPGLSKEKLATLFRPFHRLHEPNSGRGLSLSLMEELAHAQGGVVGHVAGSLGNPTFYFTVPS